MDGADGRGIRGHDPHRSARRPDDRRSVAGPGRALCDDGARRPRRAGDQGRAAGDGDRGGRRRQPPHRAVQGHRDARRSRPISPASTAARNRSRSTSPTRPTARVFDALVARADVLVENFRPGVMDRLGLGWAALHAKHPRLIYAATSGFGHTGPDRDRPAYDMIVQAMGGIMSVTGWPGGPPTRVGTSIGDITAGLFTVAGILAALHDRDADRRGALRRRRDARRPDRDPRERRRALCRHRRRAGAARRAASVDHAVRGLCLRRRPYRRRGGQRRLFSALAAALDLPDLAADPRFATNAARTDHADALGALIEARLAAHDAAHWLDPRSRRRPVRPAPRRRPGARPPRRSARATWRSRPPSPTARRCSPRAIRSS